MSVEEFMKEYERSNREHDLDRVRSLIADDALFWFSNGTSHPGIERIAESYQTQLHDNRRRPLRDWTDPLAGPHRHLRRLHLYVPLDRQNRRQARSRLRARNFSTRETGGQLADGPRASEQRACLNRP
jgi:hypothetical protein